MTAHRALPFQPRPGPPPPASLAEAYFNRGSPALPGPSGPSPQPDPKPAEPADLARLYLNRSAASPAPSEIQHLIPRQLPFPFAPAISTPQLMPFGSRPKDQLVSTFPAYPNHGPSKRPLPIEPSHAVADGIFEPALGSPRAKKSHPNHRQGTPLSSDPSSSHSRRLSQSLAPQDPYCRPYACAYHNCSEYGRPGGVYRPPNSARCYRTSGELMQHWRTVHEGTKPWMDKPFMCAMDGCGIDWKNIAGIQYHIQVSNAHSNNSDTRPGAPPPPPPPQPATEPHRSPSTLSGSSPVDLSAPPQQPGKRKTKTAREREAARKYACPVPGCRKSYQQTHGLKYHLTQGQEHAGQDIGDANKLVDQSIIAAGGKRKGTATGGHFSGARPY